MRKVTKSFLVLFLAATYILCFTACDKNVESMEQSNLNLPEQSQSLKNLSIEKSGLWEKATYTEDTELGQGSKNFVVQVKVDEQSVNFTIHTDENTVGEALLLNDLIAGDKGEYGLYVKIVNGMTADYDVDHSYWAFYIDGEYASTGVDRTAITIGKVYQLVYTK